MDLPCDEITAVLPKLEKSVRCTLENAISGKTALGFMASRKVEAKLHQKTKAVHHCGERIYIGA